MQCKRIMKSGSWTGRGFRMKRSSFRSFAGLFGLLFSYSLSFLLLEFWNWRIREKLRGGYFYVIPRPSDSYLVWLYRRKQVAWWFWKFPMQRRFHGKQKHAGNWELRQTTQIESQSYGQYLLSFNFTMKMRCVYDKSKQEMCVRKCKASKQQIVTCRTAIASPNRGQKILWLYFY